MRKQEHQKTCLWCALEWSKNVDLKPNDYPNLLKEQVWPWGPIKTIFEPGEPPAALVSNVNIVPFDDTGWLIVQDELGWGIVGGTLEPGENYIDTLKWELLEEAGSELIDYQILGALRMESLAPAPYRPHLPYPISYRVIGVGRVRRVTTPTNPEGGEKITEVGTFPLDEACRRLNQRPDDGQLLVEIYKLAATVRLG